MIKLVAGLLLISSVGHAFEPTFKRTLAGTDWFRTFQRQFPLAAPTATQIRAGGDAALCKWRVERMNGSMMGDMDPGTGEYAPKRPNANFMAWLGRCIDTLAAQDLERAVSDGKWAARLLENPAQAPADLLQKRWLDLTPADRASIIKFQVKRLIGPGLLAKEDSWVARADDALAARASSVKDAYLRIVAWVAARPEYLDY